MPTARPFAYNPGAPIFGTEQIGQIAIGTTTQDYVDGYGGVRWWNGPDEELGYVICYSVPTLDHPSPEGNIAGVGFFRSKLLTEESFITIAEYVSDFTQSFATGDDAKTWLNANGYWTSWTTPPNGVLRRSSGVFETYTGATITTFSSTTFSISGSAYLPVFDGQTKSFTHGGIEVNDTVTIGVSGTPYFLVALTKNSTTFSQTGLWYTSESGFTINTAISTGDTFTVSVSVPVREYENSGTGNSAIEACSAYPSASTSKYSVLPWVNWGTDTYIFNDSQFTSPYTSAYVANVESGGSDILWKQTDSSGKVINQGTCASVTPTPSPTPTVTPTTPSANLLVYLDSGNPSSYPGVGSTWTDLEGGDNNATLFNSPTFSSNYQGILQFDDASLEYATIPDLGNLSEWTVEVWFRLTSPLTGKVTSIISNEFDLVDRLNFSIGTNNAPTNTNLSVGFFDGTWRTTTGVIPQVGVWYQVVGTYDGSVVRQYVNGVASGGTVNYVGTPESGGEVRLMRRWDLTAIASNLVDGDLAIVKIYNGAISDSEVLSSYNSTYTRFLDITPTPTATSTPTVTPTNSTTPNPTTTPTGTSTPTPTPSLPAPTSGFTATIQEVGSDVVWSGSGTFNLTDLTFTTTSNITAGYNASQAIWAVGSNVSPGDSIDNYDGVTVFPTSFGSGGTGPTSNSGATFGIIPGGIGRTLLVPAGYVSGTFLSGSTTYASQTLSSMGLTPGTYVYSWGSGANADSLTLTIGN